MKSFRLAFGFVLWALVAIQLEAADELTRREWKVDGVTREALVYVPAKAKTDATPIVFAFHGHGGNMNNAARMFAFEKVWLEAIVVYPQGLNTPGRLTDPEGKRPGWQSSAGKEGDRDLKFFDAILASLKEDYRVDEKRLYATGHSNGGGFTYLLWEQRADKFAAFAPCAAAAGGVINLTKPKPVMHIAGEKDPLVKFEWQQRTMDTVRQLNQCGEGKSTAQYCTEYGSKAGAPMVAYVHPGAHVFPKGASEIVVKFLKDHAKP